MTRGSWNSVLIVISSLESAKAKVEAVGTVRGEPSQEK